jgi:hypothetical protein
MAGAIVGALRALDNFHFHQDRPHFHAINERIDRSLANSINSSSELFSLQSKESSVDLKPTENLLKILELKRNHITDLFQKLRSFDLISCIFGVCGTVLSITSIELDEKNAGLINIVCVLISISTFVLIYCLFNSAMLSFEIGREKQMGHIEGTDKFFSKSEDFRWFLYEAAVYMLHPLPFLDFQLEFSQLNGVLYISINEILASITLLRVFVLLKLFRHFSQWTNEKAAAICDLYAAKANTGYALKALLHEKPIPLLAILMGLSVLVFSFAVKIYEQNFHSFSGSQDYSYIWNSMWLVMLTMTTVGYGDFYPQTHIGRLILVLAAFWGIFIVSLIVLILTNFSLFSPAQLRSYSFMKRLDLKKKAQRFAAVYLTSIIQLFILNRKRRLNRHKALQLQIKIKIYFRKFKKSRNEYTRVEKSPEEMLRMINDRLRLEIEQFEEKLSKAKEMENQIDLLLESQENSIDYLKQTCKTMREVKYYCTETMVAEDL